MTLGWDASMETGDPIIDRQHREIIELVDGIKSPEFETRDDHEVLSEVLGRVMDITIAHFAMEEDLMSRVGYPADLAAEMIDEHRQFTAYARFRVLEFRATVLVSVTPLRDFLRDWLVAHEFGLDRGLAEWIQASQAESAG